MVIAQPLIAAPPAHFLRRDKARAQQPGRVQRGQPLAVGPGAFASRQIARVRAVDHRGGGGESRGLVDGRAAHREAGSLEHFGERQPGSARGLHRHGGHGASAPMIAGRGKARGEGLKAARRLAGPRHENLRGTDVDARRVRMDLLQHTWLLSFCLWFCASMPRPAGETTKGHGHAAKRERPARLKSQSLRGPAGVTKKPRAATGAKLRNGPESTGRRTA